MKSILTIIFVLFQVYATMAQVAQFDLKVFLEGSFFNNQMTPYLNDLDVLPASQPYNTSPWDYSGSESVGTIPTTTVVDWVLVDLVQVIGKPDNQIINLISRRAAFVLEDGKIKDLDGVSYLSLITNNATDFHIRIHHRNHLSVTSAVALKKVQGIYSFDFTSSSEQALEGSYSQKLLSSGVWGLMAADGNSNGQINNSDKNEIWLSQLENSGYFDGDFNLDGQVNFEDLNTTWTLNAGQGNDKTRDHIIVCPENGRYFSVGGKALLLSGSHTWDNLQDLGDVFEYDDYLDWMVNLKHNFMRMWAWESPKGTDWANDQNLDISPIPYPLIGTQYDVTQLNQSYFNRLTQRIQKANDKGIYVSIMFFEGFSAEHASIAWSNHPFKAENNINGIDVDQFDVHTIINADVNQAQKLYVREIIDLVNYYKFNNVLYEIANEIPYTPNTDLWQNEMIDYIHTYELETYGMNRPVGKTYQYNTGQNQYLYNSHADWISPNMEGGFDCRDGDAPIADGNKVIISDTDHFYFIWYTNTGFPIDFVWKSFTGGINPIHMDNWGGGTNEPGRLLGPTNYENFNLVRYNMGFAVELAERMDLLSTTPQPLLSSSGFCLASINEYVVYLPENITTVTVDLSNSNGQFTVEWLNTDTGGYTQAGEVPAGGSQVFNSPVGDYAILYLKKKN